MTPPKTHSSRSLLESKRSHFSDLNHTPNCYPRKLFLDLFGPDKENLVWFVITAESWQLLLTPRNTVRKSVTLVGSILSRSKPTKVRAGLARKERLLSIAARC